MCADGKGAAILFVERYFVRKLAILISLVFSTAALAATPSAGVPLEVRRGFFTETGVGVGFNVGGYDGYSNASLYLQLGLGYQIAFNEGRSIIPIGLHVGFASNAQNCWSERQRASPSEQEPFTGNCVDPSITGTGPEAEAARAIADNFTQTFIDLSAGYLHRLGDGYITSRLFLGGKLMGGIALVDPLPVPGGSLVNGNAGAALAFEWATMVDHFSVGLDLGFRFIIGPNISTITAALRVQYTF